MPFKKKVEIANRKMQAWEMLKNGSTYKEIADHFGVLPRQIYFDIAAVQAQWQIENNKNIIGLMQNELNQINDLQIKAEEYLENSGDSRWAASIQWCITKRVELFGLIKNKSEIEITRLNIEPTEWV